MNIFKELQNLMIHFLAAALGAVMVLISLLPFWVLHRLSDGLFFIIYYALGYRKKVVQQNLRNSFPQKSLLELRAIEIQFYKNLCDLIFETIKTFTMSKAELQSRCQLKTPEEFARVKAAGRNVMGISSHLGSWEWLSMDLGLQGGLEILAVYKPLSQKVLDRLIRRTRERFGTKMTPMKEISKAMGRSYERNYMLGLLSDQAPHHYHRAFQLRFLNQDTYVVPGPGVLTVQHDLLPIWGWVKRVGRSRYEWGVEIFDLKALQVSSNSAEITADLQQQVNRIATEFSLSQDQAMTAYCLTREYTRRLEVQIQAAPQDWLWSHRRWKSR
jgi:KDO2-lipid IV(A) lauroyltransferase